MMALDPFSNRIRSEKYFKSKVHAHPSDSEVVIVPRRDDSHVTRFCGPRVHGGGHVLAKYLNVKGSQEGGDCPPPSPRKLDLDTCLTPEPKNWNDLNYRL